MQLRSQVLLVVAFFAAVASANYQPGMRGILIYTNDESFTGAELFAQEVNGKTFASLLSAKEFVSKPKSLQSSYDLLSLLDGRCDIQLKCEKKECSKTSGQSCPPRETCPTCPKSDCKITTPSITTPGRVTEKITTPRVTKTITTPRVTEKITTPRVTEKITTPRVTETITTTKGRITPPPPGRTNRCTNGASDSSFPDCCVNGGSGPDCCKNGGLGPYCCKNGVLDSPDCCENGGSGKYCCENGANNKDCCDNGGKGKYCCVGGNINSPDCGNKKITSKTTTPQKEKEITTPKTTPPYKEKITTPKTTPRKVVEITTPRTVTEKNTTPTTTKFTGPTYIPIVNTNPSTTFEPWTGTYVANTGTFRQSYTWVPYTHTGTWKTRATRPIKPITKPPKYSKDSK